MYKLQMFCKLWYSNLKTLSSNCFIYSSEAYRINTTIIIRADMTLQYSGPSIYRTPLGTRRHCVLYIEVVLSLEVQNILSRYELLHLGPLNLSFIWRLFLLYPLYGVSIKRGSTVYNNNLFMFWFVLYIRRFALIQ